MNAMTAAAVRSALKKIANPAKASHSARFFKTGPGQYGEGDIFLGITVPQLRQVVKAHPALPLREIRALLHSKLHEERLAALLILTAQASAKAATLAHRKACFEFYVKNLKWVNNWDLVDSSAEYVVGAWLSDKDRNALYRMAKSKHLWTRRVAIISTFDFIKRGQHLDTFKIAEILLDDEEDLMHKAVGWMLREVGKRVDADRLRGFLKKNAARLPRTALRYSIERFSKAERDRWLRTGGSPTRPLN